MAISEKKLDDVEIYLAVSVYINIASTVQIVSLPTTESVEYSIVRIDTATRDLIYKLGHPN